MSKEVQDSTLPTPGQQIITATAFIHHEFEDGHKVFLPKRADTKGFLPGVYELPGGHIDFGENLVVGLKREIREELGVEINVGDQVDVFDYMNLIKESHSIEVVYFAEFVGSIDGYKLNPKDHSSADWFSRQDVVRRRSEIVPTEHVEFDDSDDPEYMAILRGFELLGDAALKFS